MSMSTNSKITAITRRHTIDEEEGVITQAHIDADHLEALVASLGNFREDQLGANIRMSARLVIRVLSHALDEVGMLTADIGLAMSALFQVPQISIAAAREGTPVAATLPDLNNEMVSAVVGLGYVPASTLAEAEAVVSDWLDGIDPSRSASPTRTLAIGAARALQAMLVILDGGESNDDAP